MTTFPEQERWECCGDPKVPVHEIKEGIMAGGFHFCKDKKKTPEEIMQNLSALLYYQSKPKRRPKGEPPVSFEDLPPEGQEPFKSLASAVLISIDQLNLRLAPKLDEDKAAQVEIILKSRIEATVRDFFDKITVWKKGLIPQEELVARLYQILGGL